MIKKLTEIALKGQIIVENWDKTNHFNKSEVQLSQHFSYDSIVCQLF